MNNTAEQDHWRQKYFDGLARLETEQAHFKALETTLKRLAGRLCTAALGQSPQLDEQLRKLQTAMRRETSGDELEKITPALTDAIQALDHSPTRTSTPATNVTHVTPSIAQETQAQKPALDEKQVRSILSALLIELRRDIELAIQVDALDSRLEQALTAEELPRILSEVADVIGQRISRIERAKHEIEALLSHMVGKLDEIGHFVAEQDRSQHASRANSETLNTQLVVEMKAMGESVDAARDLQQIRAQVRGRLESIDRRLQEFRQRETELTAAANARNEQMRSRRFQTGMRMSGVSKKSCSAGADSVIRRASQSGTWIASSTSTIPTGIAQAIVSCKRLPTVCRGAFAPRTFSLVSAARSS